MPVPISSCSYLGPSYLPKPTRLGILQPPKPPTAIKLQSSRSVEHRIHRGLHCLVINTLAGAEARSAIALAFHSAKKGTTLLPPQGETLPHDCHLLAQFLPGSGPHRQLPSHPRGPLVALSGRTLKSQLRSKWSHPFSQLHSDKNSVNRAARQAVSRWDPAHTSYKGPGRGQRVHAFINPVPPREYPTERTDQNPSLGNRRRFRDDGEAKHSTSPAGRGALGGNGSILGSRRVRASPPWDGGGVCQALHMDSEVERSKERGTGKGERGPGSLPFHPTGPSHNHPLRGSHHPRRKCVCGIFDLRT